MEAGPTPAPLSRMTKHSAFLYLAAGAGAALGGMARFWMSGVAATLISETFPVGHDLVNVIGSTFIGFFATLTAPAAGSSCPPRPGSS